LSIVAGYKSNTGERVINKAILVVDDDPHMLALLGLILKQHGYAVVKASNAEIALHLAKSFSPNLFIFDILMPGMNGFQLCEAVRTLPHAADTPIIILTALDDSGSRRMALEAGASVFVPKDQLSSALIQAVRALISNGSLPRNASKPA
jgi:putative two-component system response regulator